MLKTWFIVGTDTDCGKTYVTVALLEYLRQQKQVARALKPVASGCTEEHGVLVNEDIQRLEHANGVSSPPIHHWVMPLAISPHLAAKAEGLSLSVAEIQAFYESYPSKDLDYLFIEGAGGLFVPLNEQETWVDFLCQTQLPVILVVGMRLGCINHALLTAYALKQHQLTCVGWIANFIDPHMLVPTENLDTIAKKLDCPLLGTVPFQGMFVPQPTMTVYGSSY